MLFSAIVIPAGSFLSVIGHDPKKPNALVSLLWIGFALLSVSLVIGGIGLIVAGASAVG